MAQRFEPADSLDYFPTPAWATRALCEWLDVKGKTCWEPAAGEGHMVRPLQEHFASVYGSDVHDYGAGFDVVDFLQPSTLSPDWIISNPPFALAEQFVKAATHRAKEGVAMLVRTSFLEGVGRFERIYNVTPPDIVFQFAERVPMVKGRVDRTASTATSYCWLVWFLNTQSAEPDGLTHLHWIEPCRKRLEKDSDYV